MGGGGRGEEEGVEWWSVLRRKKYIMCLCVCGMYMYDYTSWE